MKGSMPTQHGRAAAGTTATGAVLAEAVRETSLLGRTGPAMAPAGLGALSHPNPHRLGLLFVGVRK